MQLACNQLVVVATTVRTTVKLNNNLYNLFVELQLTAQEFAVRLLLLVSWLARNLQE